MTNTNAHCLHDGKAWMGQERRLGLLVRPVRDPSHATGKDGVMIENDISDEVKAVSELLPEGKNLGAQKVDEARKLMFCPYPNYIKAIPLLKEAAKLCDTNAMWMLAQLFMEGKHTKRDIEKAWDYARKSSRSGNPIGSYWLSKLYDSGEGTEASDPQDNAKRAKALLGEARTKLIGEVEGRRTKGLNSDFTELSKADVWETLGRIMEVNEKDASMEPFVKKYFTNAANEGSSYALRRMGDWCLNGSFLSLYNIYDRKVDSQDIPTIPSYSQAMTYYNRAANLGDAEAQNILGVLIIQKSVALNGKTSVSTKDNYYLKEAFDYFCKSATQGNTDAFYNLAYCYENSYGCERDIQAARHFYQSAANAGSKKAEIRLKALQNR